MSQVATVKKPVDSTWEVLALLRFVLAMIVVGSHVRAFANPGTALGWILNLSPFAAVLSFLVVSGFSIAHSLSRRSDQFYRRRFLRIYPLYAISLIVPLSVQAMRGHLLPNATSAGVMNLFFLQNFLCWPSDLNPALWTLAVEAACYLFAPAMAKASTMQLLCVAGLSALGFVIYPRVHPGTYYMFLPHGHAFYMLSWAWLAGFIYHRHRHEPLAPVALTLAIFSIMSVNSLFTDKYYGLTLALAIGALTMGNKLALPRLARKSMSFAGDLSFPLYLFHFPIFFCCSGMLHIHSAIGLVVIALVSGSAGIWLDAQLRQPAQVIFDRAASVAMGARRSLALAATSVSTLAGGALRKRDESLAMMHTAVESARLAA